MDNFEIKIKNLQWLSSMKEDEDLCLHGSFFVKIGDEIICDDDDDCSTTASAAVLFLMRTISIEHTKDHPLCENLMPCCGFSMYESCEDPDTCWVSGCPCGENFYVYHEGDFVILETEKGLREKVSLNTWKAKILELAIQVENKYESSKEKKLDESEDKRGYDAFWREWKKRKADLLS